MNRGIALGVSAYLVWGVLPIFWKLLDSVNSLDILAHRFVWSTILLAAIISIRHRWSRITSLGRRALVRLWFAGLLLSVNWGTYIWAVNADHIVQTSLGYFINPLLSVLLGVIVLRERLDPGQWVAVGIAGIGVAYMTVQVGALPWIALVLAGTFATYALLKKTAKMIGPIESLAVEVSAIVIPALVFLIARAVAEQGAFVSDGPRTTLLLVLTGVATAVPLMLFGAAAQRVKLATIGILQYIAPSMQFLIGVFVYNEEVTGHELVGFILVWIALAVFTAHGVLRARRMSPALQMAGSAD